MITIVIEGNTTDEPELRFTPSGKAVAQVRVLVTDRVKDTDTGEYSDGATTGYRVTVWGKPGENVAAQVGKGHRLLIVGELAVREYTDKDNNTRTSREITATHAGHSTRFAGRTGGQVVSDDQED